MTFKNLLVEFVYKPFQRVYLSDTPMDGMCCGLLSSFLDSDDVMEHMPFKMTDGIFHASIPFMNLQRRDAKTGEIIEPDHTVGVKTFHTQPVRVFEDFCDVDRFVMLTGTKGTGLVKDHVFKPVLSKREFLSFNGEGSIAYAVCADPDALVDILLAADQWTAERCYDGGLVQSIKITELSHDCSIFVDIPDVGGTHLRYLTTRVPVDFVGMDLVDDMSYAQMRRYVKPPYTARSNVQRPDFAFVPTQSLHVAWLERFRTKNVIAEIEEFV